MTIDRAPAQQAATVAATVPWARQPATPAKPATGRFRRMVDTLPDWEPLPPGEILVRRRGHEET